MCYLRCFVFGKLDIRIAKLCYMHVLSDILRIFSDEDERNKAVIEISEAAMPTEEVEPNKEVMPTEN